MLSPNTHTSNFHLASEKPVSSPIICFCEQQQSPCSHWPGIWGLSWFHKYNQPQRLHSEHVLCAFFLLKRHFYTSVQTSCYQSKVRNFSTLNPCPPSILNRLTLQWPAKSTTGGVSEKLSSVRTSFKRKKHKSHGPTQLLTNLSRYKY